VDEVDVAAPHDVPVKRQRNCSDPKEKAAICPGEGDAPKGSAASKWDAPPGAAGVWRSLKVKMRAAHMNRRNYDTAELKTTAKGVEWVLQKAPDFAITCSDEVIVFHFPPRPLAKAGDRVSISMQWTTVYPTATYPLPGAACPSSNGVHTNNTRCMMGTGDFRIGMLQSAEGRLDNAPGVQFRVSPHLSTSIRTDRYMIDFVVRAPCDDPWFIESSVKGGQEPHTNASVLTRERRGSCNSLGHAMDDQCSSEDAVCDGWYRPKGVKACGWNLVGERMKVQGAGAPYNTPFPVKLEVTRGSGSGFVFVGTVNGREFKQKGEFTSGFSPSTIDSLCLTFTNSWRVYGTVRLENVTVS
jgi:hypothetical protein